LAIAKDRGFTLIHDGSPALAVFGAQVGASVSAMLADRDVRLVCASVPRGVDRRGLRLRDGGIIEADRVLAAPALVGQRIAGVPAEFGGFVQTGALGRAG
jgi:hypothetical protein